jgi:hypothetical protein
LLLNAGHKVYLQTVAYHKAHCRNRGKVSEKAAGSDFRTIRVLLKFASSMCRNQCNGLKIRKYTAQREL